MWRFRLLIAAVSPLLVLAFLEGGLRLADYGHPTSFFLPDADGSTVQTNPRFGYRYFPPSLARAPLPLRIERVKSESTVRLFVLGGSAAYGTPEASLGFGPILQEMLEDAFPESRFEVVVTAMAAVNSHVVREIARECARLEPDFFLVYLGNNEVVGPFGPGTAFGQFTPYRAIVRLNLSLSRLRLAQLIRTLLRQLGRPSAAPRWQGMEMFLDHQVAADDTRLERVADSLAANLRAIRHSGHGAGAHVVMSTVGTNIATSPPFAARHSADLSYDEVSVWSQWFEIGVNSLEIGDTSAAVKALQQALTIDDRHADLHFALGSAMLQAGLIEDARAYLLAARDLDALRFRSDSRLNDVIRRIALESATDISFIDTATLFETHQLIGGSHLFYEHVHLNFDGNYSLATLFFEEVANQLVNLRGLPRPGQPLSKERVAERLGLTPHDDMNSAAAMLEMQRRPPFTHQLGHESRIARMREALHLLRLADLSERKSSRDIYLGALARNPENFLLRARYAGFEAQAGNPASAATEWRKLVTLFPEADAWRTALAFALVDQGRFADARDELERVTDLYPESADALTNLGALLTEYGSSEEAENALAQALALDSGSEHTLVNLAKLRERQGRSEVAESIYRDLLQRESDSIRALRALAELLDRSGRLEEAEATYRLALARDPDSAAVANNLGFLLERQGGYEEAASFYRQSIRSDPGYSLAYFNLGDILLVTGQSAEAIEAYAAGLELAPDNEQARANLEMAQAAAR
jgi:tetratricopeptide (TPR) repeat protein